MNVFDKLKKVFKNPYIVFPYLGSRKLMNWLPDRLYLKACFRARMNEKLDFNRVKTFNEKLQWLKLYDKKNSYTGMVDKYEVRTYIKKRIGEEYLIPLLGVYDSFDEIDFRQLPNQFVLKCTHDSGGIVVCKDKSKLDIEAARKKINKSLKRNYFYLYREWPYKNVKPRIICEKYMEDDVEKELKDYKVMCFNGEVKCTFVCLNRNSPSGLNIDIYDYDWELMPFQRPQHPNSGVKVSKPKNYNKMVKFAEKLSKDIPFLRVDFYEINGRLYFGELTFYPGSGLEKFEPEYYDEILGSWLDLSGVK